MKDVKTYQGKKILVLGAGLSGVNAAKLLTQLGAHVTISDNKPLAKLPKAKSLADHSSVQLVAGSQTPAILTSDYDLMVKNPGISYDNPVVQKALKMHLPMMVEVELASEINPGHLICVTGSNGKTTTVMLITRMLNRLFKKQGKHAYDAGNIGISASMTAEKMKAQDTMVMEISSFMLLGITNLHPDTAVITNIAANHLDYHKTRANYVRSKMRITKNQTAQDHLVLNYNTKEMQKLGHLSKAQVVPFCTNGATKAGAYEEDGKLYFKGTYIMDAKDIHIHGQYNVENALAAIAVASMRGVAPEDMAEVLKTFQGASNRNHYVLTYKKRIFFNDSKSTDAESTMAAVESFHHPEVLLLGGLDRGYRMPYFKKILPDLKKYVRGVVTYGQNKEVMAKVAKAAGVPHIKVVDTLDQAVPAAYQISNPDNVILLSPANASWDQFPNFEVRGARYVKDIKQMIKNKKD